MKLLAAAAVVWIHVSNCEESQRYLALCRFAVPFFTCAAVYFVLHKAFAARAASWAAYCTQRAQRLYVPFLIWAVLYLIVRWTKHATMEDGSPIVLTPAVLLNGTAHHLWFLPFICVVSVSAFALGRVLAHTPRARGRWLGVILPIAGTAVALLPDPVEIRAVEAPISYFADHALDTLPSVFFGAGVFFLVRNSAAASERGFSRPGVRAIALLVAFTCIAWEFRHGGHAVAPHVAGAALLFVAMTQPNRPWFTPVREWSNVAFAIYLIHVLFVEALQFVQNRFGGVMSPAADLSVWALALVASALTAKFMVRTRALRWACPQ